MRILAACLLCLVWAGAAESQTTLAVRLPDGRAVPVDLATLPRQAQAVEQRGSTITFEGVLLRDILAKAGIESGAKLRGPVVSRYVLVVARDGYRVTFSLGELDAEFTGLPVLVADRRAGKPLDEDEGPLRLIVPGDRHGSRSARQVERIELHEPPK